jgi:PBP1b-binding outer membrane lipoprotein LpoB
MKKSTVLIISLLIGGCSGEQVEEFAFRKTMEHQLKNECGEENKECIKAVEEQIESCMKKSDWRKYLENDEDEGEMKRFISEFFPCFKDSDGRSYFN